MFFYINLTLTSKNSSSLSDFRHLFEDCINKIQMKDLRNLTQMKKNTGCEYVPHCRGCRAIAYATTGNYMAKDPMCFRNLVKSSDLKDMYIENATSETNNC